MWLMKTLLTSGCTNQRGAGQGLWLGAPGVQVVIFFLACVLAAGIFGALTASRKILYIQALPALLALVAVLTQA